MRGRLRPELYLCQSGSSLCEAFCSVGLFPCYAELLTAHVAVCGELSVLGLPEVEHLDDGRGTEVEFLLYSLGEYLVAVLACAECVNEYGNGLSNADSVGELNLALLSKACGNYVLGYVA